MNKYFIKIPYNYIQYGELSGYVYAENEEEAAELARERTNIHDDTYEDEEGDSTTYSYENIDIELEEEDVWEVPRNTHFSPAYHNQLSTIPSYYLLEVNSI